MLISKRCQRDVGPADRQHGYRQQPVKAVDRGRRIHCPREQDQDRHADRRADRRNQQPVGNDARLRLLRIGEQLRETAPKPKGGDLRGELDGQHRISESAERGGAIHSPANEQERQHPH